MTRTVLITGCSSGFGRAMVPAFRRRGWKVIAGVRGGRERGAGLDAEIADLDVTSADDRARVAGAIERLDCLINNAGYGMFGPFEESSEAEIRRQIETNLVGAMLLTRDCLPLLRASHGRIINVSSVLGFMGFPMMSLYCASKFGIEGWSEALYYELKPHGVSVTVVEPSGYRTQFGTKGQWPEARLADYASQREAMEKMRAKITARASTRVDRVAERVAALADSTAHPLRLRVDADGRFTWALRKWLPGKAMTALLGRAFARMARTKS